MPSHPDALEAKADILAAEAEHFARQGQLQASARLWDQVLALRPDHAGALTFQGAAALARGDLDAAAHLLGRAVLGTPPIALAHAHLARVHMARGDTTSALAQLDKALAIEPSAYAAHLEKAAIYGQLGREKDQALAYGRALQLLPAQAAQLPGLQAVLAKARRAVAENQSQLGEFLSSRLATVRPADSRSTGRFDESLDISLGRKPLQVQKPAMFHVPGLPAIAFFEREEFDWAPAVEACTTAIRAELDQVLQDHASGFIPYVQTPAGEPVGQFAALDHNPDWSAYFLWQHGRLVDDHAARCPATMAMLEIPPQVAVRNRAPAAFFSALKPRTRIPPHHGATNCRLTCHLPLVIPPGCALQVGNHVRQWTPGELLIFDDTIEHAAWNDSDQLRVVLIFDIWHPMLTPTERLLVRETLEGIMAYYGHDAPLGEL